MTLEQLIAHLTATKQTFSLVRLDGNPEVMDHVLIHREGAFEVKAAADNENVIEMIGSDETVDRYGEVVSVDGWQLDNYRKNPVVLLGHDHLQVAARTLDVGVREIGGKRRLWFRIEFPTKDISEAGWQIGQLYRHGYMKASSVGFIPLDWEFAPEGVQGKDGVDAPRLIYKEQDLLELSLVAVPANPSAVMLHLEEARAKGMLTEESMAVICKGLGLVKDEAPPAAAPAPEPVPVEAPAPVAPEDPLTKAMRGIEALSVTMGNLEAAAKSQTVLLGDIKTMLQELLLTTDPPDPVEPTDASPKGSSRGVYDGILKSIGELRGELKAAKPSNTKGGAS